MFSYCYVFVVGLFWTCVWLCWSVYLFVMRVVWLLGCCWFSLRFIYYYLLCWLFWFVLYVFICWSSFFWMLDVPLVYLLIFLEYRMLGLCYVLRMFRYLFNIKFEACFARCLFVVNVSMCLIMFVFCWHVLLLITCVVWLLCCFRLFWFAWHVDVLCLWLFDVVYVFLSGWLCVEGCFVRVWLSFFWFVDLCLFPSLCVDLVCTCFFCLFICRYWWLFLKYQVCLGFVDYCLCCVWFLKCLMFVFELFVRMCCMFLLLLKRVFDFRRVQCWCVLQLRVVYIHMCCNWILLLFNSHAWLVAFVFLCFWICVKHVGRCMLLDVRHVVLIVLVMW